MTFRDDRDAMLARLDALQAAADERDVLRARVAVLEEENAALRARLDALAPLPAPEPPAPAPPPARALRFAIRDASGDRVLDLAQGVIKIGRLRSAHILLDDAVVSRLHAVIENGADQVHLIDLGSTVGTYVNGQKINKVALRDGDAIQVGDSHLRVRFG